MSKADFDLSQGHLRGTDSNSLLRLSDHARAAAEGAPSQLVRLQAGKALQRVTRELQRRKVLS